MNTFFSDKTEKPMVGLFLHYGDSKYQGSSLCDNFMQLDKFDQLRAFETACAILRNEIQRGAFNKKT